MLSATSHWVDFYQYWHVQLNSSLSASPSIVSGPTETWIIWVLPVIRRPNIAHAVLLKTFVYRIVCVLGLDKISSIDILARIPLGDHLVLSIVKIVRNHFSKGNSTVDKF